MNELTQEELLEYVKVKAYQLQSVMKEVPQELVQHIFQRYQLMTKMTSQQIVIDDPDLVKEVPEPVTPSEETVSEDQSSNPEPREHDQGEGSAPQATD